ncbi:MAG TPA: hypothetical protein VEL03_14390 [Streptosporangiaceae bacterium]|nr:hypothetical protein [Streptosporangiaceae bacterium]
MAAEFKNIAKDNARVGSQISVANAPVSVHAPMPAESIDGKFLLDQIDDLRRAVVAARHANALTEQESAAAQEELDVASAQVGAAVEGHRDGLLASLRRLASHLVGAVDLASKLAEIVQAVKGMR